MPVLPGQFYTSKMDSVIVSYLFAWTCDKIIVESYRCVKRTLRFLRSFPSKLDQKDNQTDEEDAEQADGAIKQNCSGGQVDGV